VFANSWFTSPYPNPAARSYALRLSAKNPLK
jgi:hypothetical protein